MVKQIADQDATIPVRLHPSGFDKADSNFYSLTLASDGCLYYTLSSHDIDTHGRMYKYDPASDEVSLICDLGEVAGETGLKALPQGKSHSPYFELDGTLYFATQYGYFATTDARERPAEVPQGYKPYPGGHLMSYNMRTGELADLAKTRSEEGIITLNMDARRGRLYGLTWPTGRFLIYDIALGTLRDLGPCCGGGEVGTGEQYFCLVRSFAVDPRDGVVYFTRADGAVLRYCPHADDLQLVEGLSMKRDIFGQWDHTRPGHQGYNWRDIVWHEESQLFYGVHPKSGWLFTFDPHGPSINLVERICADRLRRAGQFEPFRYGYLTLKFGLDGQTLYYLTGCCGPTSAENRMDEHTIHLVTYNIRTQSRVDHGVLRFEDGSCPRMSQCLAIAPNGRLYSAPWIERTPRQPNAPARWRCDLISFPDPLADA